MSYKIDKNVCISCGQCASNCPQDAIASGSPYEIDPAKCVDCGVCASMCPVDAISPSED